MINSSVIRFQSVILTLKQIKKKNQTTKQIKENVAFSQDR